MGGTPAETGARVKAAKAAGEAVSVETEQPVVAFLCDTTAEIFASPGQLDLIRPCPVIMIECNV